MVFLKVSSILGQFKSFKEVLSFRWFWGVFLVILQFLKYFWLFYRFQGYFHHSRKFSVYFWLFWSFWGILIILMVSRIFSHSSDFGGIFFIIVVLGYIYIYIGHSSSFGSILVILEVMRFFFGLFFRFHDIFHHLEVSMYFCSF